MRGQMAAAEEIYAACRRGRPRRRCSTTATSAPGVKFKDADLLGIPVRVTIGNALAKEGVVEVKERRAPAPGAAGRPGPGARHAAVPGGALPPVLSPLAVLPTEDTRAKVSEKWASPTFYFVGVMQDERRDS
mgnify:CR=1 FL=1